MKPGVDQLLVDRMAEAASLYHRLVLLVGPPRSGRTTHLRGLSTACGAPLVNLNLELSERLLELTSKQRSVRVPRLLTAIVDAGGADAILLDNIEILFSRELKLDPLRLLQSLSRRHTVVASWTGRHDGTHLTYAEPGHPEYRKYSDLDALIVPIAGDDAAEGESSRMHGSASGGNSA